MRKNTKSPDAVSRATPPRLPEYFLFAQYQRNQQAAKTAVAIQERMDGFKLHVGQCGLEQGREGRGIFWKELARYFSISWPSVSQAIKRGEKFAKENDIKLLS